MFKRLQNRVNQFNFMVNELAAMFVHCLLQATRMAGNGRAVLCQSALKNSMRKMSAAPTGQ